MSVVDDEVFVLFVSLHDVGAHWVGDCVDVFVLHDCLVEQHH